jgi:hypothetical protein
MNYFIIHFATVVNQIYRFHTTKYNYKQIIILIMGNVIFVDRKITDVFFIEKLNFMQCVIKRNMAVGLVL